VTPAAEPTIHPADPGDALAVRRLLDAAFLDLGEPGIESRVRDGRVVVADAADALLGALAFAPHERGGGAHVEAVAVRRARRGQGIGTALVDWLRARGRVTADCRPGVRPFYAALGFRLTEREGRLYGVIESRPPSRTRTRTR
jgi:GNAT superfamily N-acetyltransferase